MDCGTFKPTNCNVCKSFVTDYPSRTYSCVKSETICVPIVDSWKRTTLPVSQYPTEEDAREAFLYAIAYENRWADCEGLIEGETDWFGELIVEFVSAPFSGDYWVSHYRHTHRSETVYRWDEEYCPSRDRAVQAIEALRRECLLDTYLKCRSCGDINYSALPDPITAASNQTVWFSRECNTGPSYAAFIQEESRTGCCYDRTCNC